jgi:hypothetical protein
MLFGFMLGFLLAAVMVLVTLMNFVGADMDRFMRYLDGVEK